MRSFATPTNDPSWKAVRKEVFLSIEELQRDILGQDKQREGLFPRFERTRQRINAIFRRHVLENSHLIEELEELEDAS